ncbi:MAG: hypothetical protein FJ267_11405 [Planctomycetes bacterium]|nr:hypothetical protein [Planctomycetota bacterium]
MTTFSQTNGLRLEIDRDRSLPLDGCPDLVLKTTPDRVPKLVRDVTKMTQSKDNRVTCVGLCHNGVVHCYVSESDQRLDWINTVIQSMTADLVVEGGDWHSRHRPPVAASVPETTWIETLINESGIQRM